MLPTRQRRLSSFDYVGTHRYSLTVCAFERRHLFVDDRLVNVLLSQILRAAASTGFEVIAYCFMPDHVHLVVQGLTDSSNLPRFMQRAKQYSGFHGKRLAGGPIWQTGYYERVLRESEDTFRVVSYVLENPIRAGLVTNAAEYPFSGSGVCTLRELTDFVQDHRI